MKVEIWSDVMCPFCYIGKRNFESALSQLPDNTQIEVEWKSFVLDPTLPEVPEYQDDMYKYIADRKGVSYEQSRKMHEDVTQYAKRAGLEYNFDITLVTNSLKAHRLIQFAKTKGLGDRAEECLFSAYFTRGKNLSDSATLIELGAEIGLTETEVNEALTDPAYIQSVENDVRAAQKLGIRGVPFFVVNGKYGISGAQQPENMLATLKKAYDEWEVEKSAGKS